MTRNYKSFSGLFSFTETVKNRYSDDLIMSTFITLLILLMPPILFAILKIISWAGGQYDIINDYSDAVLIDLMVFQYLVIALVAYRMYSRLASHSKRDKEWRRSLIEFAKNEGADTSDLEELNKIFNKKEKFFMKIPALVVLILMYAVGAFFFIVYIPDVCANGFVPSGDITSWVHDHIIDLTIKVTGGKDVQLDTLFSIQQIFFCMMMILFAMIIYRVFTFPRRHESRQSEFTVALSKPFSELGLSIPPIIEVTHEKERGIERLWGRSVIHKIALTVVSLGLVPAYVAILSSRSMNLHMMNQWTYETELLNYLTSETNEGFREGAYTSMVNGINQKVSHIWRKTREETKESVLKKNRMPWILIFAEIFVLILCANYCLKIIALDFEMISDYGSFLLNTADIGNVTPSSWLTMGLVAMDLALMFTTVDALLGIASRRPDSWRKVTRSCITFVVPMWLSTLISNMGGFGHLFDFNPYISTGILFDMLLIMILSVSIKKFYTPVNEDIPKTSKWLKYIVHGELFR